MTYNVLIADDEPIILEGMKLVIKWEELGLNIIETVPDGKKALEVIENNHIDILITDIRMPEMDGIELLKAVKHKYPQIKVIILSGHDDFNYVKEAARHGIENYLLKPVDEEELESTLLLIIDKIESESSTQQRLEQNINIIKNNTLLRWVTNSISQTELKKRMEILGIKQKESFLACIIHCVSKNEGSRCIEIRQKEIPEICTKIVGEDTYVFPSLDGDVIILYHSGIVDIDYKKAIQPLCEIMREISCKFGFTVHILVGSIESGYENVYVSYANALKLTDYALLHQGNKVIEYKNIQQEIHRHDMDFAVDFRKFKDLITKKDILAIHNFIKKTFACMRECENLTPSMFHGIAIRMGMLLMSGAGIMTKKKGAEGKDSIDAIFAEVWEAKSPQKLEKWVLTVADEAINSLIAADRNYSPVVKKVIDYINANYDEPIALKGIADGLNMNAVYLGQLFKNETGELFTTYLNNMRVEKAKKLLLTTKMNVSDIGMEIGYSSNNHFFQVFKKMTGLTPTEFRRLNASI